MNHFITLLLLITACFNNHVQTKPITQMFRESYMKCKMEQPGVSKNMLTDFIKKNYETSDKELKCFIYCIGYKMQLMDEQGTILFDNVIEHRPPLVTRNQIIQRVKPCLSIKQVDKCETAYLQIQCAMKSKE